TRSMTSYAKTVSRWSRRADPIAASAPRKMDDGFGDMPGAGWLNASSPGYNGSVAFLSAGSFIRRTSLASCSSPASSSSSDDFEIGSSISKTIGDETSRLQNDAAGWDQRLQELETDIDKPQDVGTTAQQIEECLVILRAGADRLGPTSETRVALRKQEGAIRDVASRAEVHSDAGVRKTATFFQQKTTDLRALNRSIEETRIL